MTRTLTVLAAHPHQATRSRAPRLLDSHRPTAAMVTTAVADPSATLAAGDVTSAASASPHRPAAKIA
jgi:hypothetical protein